MFGFGQGEYKAVDAVEEMSDGLYTRLLLYEYYCR